jgi:hypothetical protein
MEKHRGQVVEYRVRRNGYGISALARSIEVNRRSIYLWFNRKHLDREVIFKIGCVLRHDFSQEFPDLFSSEDFKTFDHPAATATYELDDRAEDGKATYMDRYLALLERYNAFLTEQLDEKI